ncbi:hypothetical protein [Acuticoccus mangrovi]|uniref:DUF2927 domain-containing protein n=1 Tax=Acuticoccus mangrovi TaxID=2796142 RepID=A0A934IV07_9HYPH|nr:hypothetical protein [Acuticoccus mangrovi]MBJ3778642.1 hypothetical protein [Acuticoccus mangrovi]
MKLNRAYAFLSILSVFVAGVPVNAQSPSSQAGAKERLSIDDDMAREIYLGRGYGVDARDRLDPNVVEWMKYQLAMLTFGFEILYTEDCVIGQSNEPIFSFSHRVDQLTKRNGVTINHLEGKTRSYSVRAKYRDSAEAAFARANDPAHLRDMMIYRDRARQIRLQNLIEGLISELGCDTPEERQFSYNLHATMLGRPPLQARSKLSIFQRKCAETLPSIVEGAAGGACGCLEETYRATAGDRFIENLEDYFTRDRLLLSIALAPNEKVKACLQD